MFMFRSRKANLIKRLFKARKKRGNETRRSLEEDFEHISNFLKSLTDIQLELLLRAIESKGHDLSNCVLLRQQIGEEPHVLFCQIWRWFDLKQGDELRRLPMCRTACDPVYICCNPYHWSRLCQPVTETPPPPYTRTIADSFKPEDRAPSEVPLLCRDSCPGSLTTNGDSFLNPLEWCKLAYWEMSDRVGPLYPVEIPAVNIFWDMLHPDGLSIQTLAQHSFSPPESVARTRCKIGLGITLSREDDMIWVYNRSEHPIFVNSLTLEASSPTRVPAEHCLCVFNLSQAAQRHFGWHVPQIGPVDINSIRISFAKGWGGHKYTRTEITACPCWLEILLAPCR